MGVIIIIHHHWHPNPHETPQKREQAKILTRMMKSKGAGDGGRSGLTGTCSTCQGTLHQTQGTKDQVHYTGTLHKAHCTLHQAQGTGHTTLAQGTRHQAHYTVTLHQAQRHTVHTLGRLGRHTALQLEDIKATCSNVKTNTHTQIFRLLIHNSTTIRQYVRDQAYLIKSFI